jgi:hypothetical protein
MAQPWRGDNISSVMTVAGRCTRGAGAGFELGTAVVVGVSDAVSGVEVVAEGLSVDGKCGVAEGWTVVPQPAIKKLPMNKLDTIPRCLVILDAPCDRFH